jgi:integrase
MGAWANLLGPETGELVTLHDVLERYKTVVLPTKAAATQRSQSYLIPVLDKVFGHMRAASLKPQDVYAYLAKRSQKAASAAIHEMKLLGHVMTKAVEWGAVEANPVRQVNMKAYTPESRRRYPTDAEFKAVYALATERQQIAMDLALLTGLRRSGVIRLTLDADTDDGLLVPRPGKTTKPLLFTWTAELRAVIDRAKRLEPRVRGAMLCNTEGEHYTPDGFTKNWGRLMAKAKKAGIARFSFQDIRAKSATDDDDALRASARLGHATVDITRRVYIRKPTKVSPLR